MLNFYLWRFVIIHPKKSYMISRGLHWSHAGPGGKLLLKTEVSWRNINGVLVNTPWWCGWFLFRRRH